MNQIKQSILELDPLAATNATASGIAYVGTLTITDDDLAPFVSFDPSSDTVVIEGDVDATFTLTLSDTSEQVITIPFELTPLTNGSDPNVWNAGPVGGGK